MNEYNKELCDERHKSIESILGKIDGNIDRLYGRLNWFYLLALGTLATVVGSLVSSCAK